MFKANMPCNAGYGRNGFKLMHDVSWNKINVIVAQHDAGIPESFPPQLVELGVISPVIWTLKRNKNRKHKNKKKKRLCLKC